MAQHHILCYKTTNSSIWIYLSGDNYRQIIEDECKAHKLLSPADEYCIIRAKSGHTRDVSAAMTALNNREPQWRDGRGGNKRGNRKGPRYG